MAITVGVENKGIKYIGPIFDGSGYAEAARNYVLSIYKKGYPITISPISFEKTRPDLGNDGNILYNLVNNNVSYDKVLVHSTPDLWEQWLVREKSDKYTIGFTVWETSKLHPIWTDACNRVNEVWVPSQWNLEVFQNSGVKTPIFKIPHAIDIPDPSVLPNFNLEGISDDIFVFYSIFQWQERKNPFGLLTAYMAAFTGVEDVVLVLKTYRHDHSGDQDYVKQLVIDARKMFNLEHFPKLFLIVENMSSDNIMSLHKRGDAFVLLQRSEGWGLPHFEAAALGNPVITPGYGGQTDFLNEENSYLVDYTQCPVYGMPWSPYYRADQFWCEPNLEDAIKKMRHVYNNRDEAIMKGQKAKNYIADNFTWRQVGDLIMNRLSEIDGRMANV